MARSFGFVPLNGNPVPNLAGGLTFANATTGAGSFDGIDKPGLSHFVGSGTLTAANQILYVPLALRKGQTVTFDADFTPGDLRLFVIDAKGVLAGENDNSGTADDGSPGTNDPKLQFTALASGVYFIALTGSGRDYLGDFQFSSGSARIGTFQLDIAVGGLPPRTIFGGAGNDVIGSSLDPSRVLLGGGDDTFSGVGSQPDIVDGGAGNDLIQPDGGDDQVTGGRGNDSLYAGPGDDIEFGGAGNDQLRDFEGHDQLFGGRGNDTIWGDEVVFDKTGNDLISGGTGNDELTPGLGFDTVLGGAGIDVVNYTLSDTAVRVNLKTGIASGQGADRISGVENVFGSAFADRITGDDGANFLAGNQGNDILNGGLGDDILIGFAGDDRMIGGPGIDLITYAFNPNGIDANLQTGIILGGSTDTVTGVENLIGTQFDDRLKGSAAPNNIAGLGGDDFIEGAEGNDVLAGNEGRDQVFGDGTFETGDNDTLTGGSGRDLLVGGGGDDVIAGEDQGDELDGTAGDDLIEGGIGWDLLKGDTGNDTLRGDAGKDDLEGGRGRDELTGGSQADKFTFRSASDLGTFGITDRITDFETGLDIISAEGIDANPATPENDAFIFRPEQRQFTGRVGEIRYFISGPETVVEFNTDADLQPNFDLVLNGRINLDAFDFFL